MRIAIIEDEAIVARRLARMVRELVGECTLEVLPTLDAAREAVAHAAHDLVFLDLNLNGQHGFRLLEEAAAAPFATIVVSAHHEEALRAFDYGVVDFVPKPWSEERLRKAVDRALGRDASPRSRAKFLTVRRGRELRTIATQEVVFVRGADDYSELHLADGSVHLHEKTLTALAAVLPETFVRVHRSFIANFARARSLRGKMIVMHDEREVPVGRVYRDAVRARFTSA